jgi:hypothetical protein
MRKTLLALPLLFVTSPALAQPVPQLPPELTDPRTVHQLVGALDQLSRALMNVRIGEAKAAIEGRDASPRERNMTVGDYARRNDPNFDRNLHQQIAGAEPQLQRGMQAMNRALPAISRALGDAEQAVDRAVANMPDPTYPRR